MKCRFRFCVPCAILFSVLFASSSRGDDDNYAKPPMPRFRIVAGGFGAREADIQAILQSNGRELWRFFPDYKIEPFVVIRGKGSPIVLHSRNPRGEIVMRLTTQKTFWCQYSYQFAHEFCHILCGYDRDNSLSEWFEETLCETASLFTMRAMARAWEKDAPYPNWVDYRHSIKKYTDNVIAKREKIPKGGLDDFYVKHRGELNKTKTNRDLNGAMAVVLLDWFEEKPSRWESVRWINTTPGSADESFGEYLGKWSRAAPERHRAFIKKIADEFGVELE